LGDKFEYSFRNSLSMGGGPLIFFTRPIPVAFILLAIIVMGLTLRYLKRVPKDAIPDDSDA
jgi:TctA family transporter